MISFLPVQNELTDAFRLVGGNPLSLVPAPPGHAVRLDSGGAQLRGVEDVANRTGVDNLGLK